MERSLEVVQGKVFDVIGVADAVIAEMAEKYLPLKINGIDDKPGFKKVHEARMIVKDSRVKVEKKRKELKEDALRYGQAIDKEANRIKSLLEPIETHLSAEEQAVEDALEAIKQEMARQEEIRIQARRDRLAELGVSFNGQMWSYQTLSLPEALLKVSNEEQFEQLYGKIKEAVDAEAARLEAELKAKKAEEERLAKIAAEQEAERQRLAEITRKQAEEAVRIKAEQEASERKAREEQERIAKEQADREAKIKADAEAAERKIREEREALEAEKKRIADAEAARLKAIEDEKIRAENEKKRQAELEQAKKEAAEKALREAKEKEEREAAEKAERERKEKEAAERKAARAPDKEKLILFAGALEAVPAPQMKTEEGRKVLGRVACELTAAIDALRKEAEAL